MAVHVFIATTEGPSRVQRIAEEDSDIPSVVCLNGTTETLSISPDYGRFVRRGSGVVARLTGHDSYRVDVDRPIDGGRSWQLGLLLSHMLVLADRFSAGDIAPDDMLILATGEVDRDLNLRPVGHIPEKISQAAILLREAAARGTRVLFILPDGEPEEPWRTAVDGAGLSDAGVDFLSVPTVAAAAGLVDLALPVSVSANSANSADQARGTQIGPALSPPPGGIASAAPRRRAGFLGIAGLALILAGATSVAAMRLAPEPTDRFLTAYGPAGLSDLIKQAAALLPGGTEAPDLRVPEEGTEPVALPEPEDAAETPASDPAPDEPVVPPDPVVVETVADPGPVDEPVSVSAVDPIERDSVVLAAAEERAPAGFTCASLRFTGDSTSTAALDADGDGGFTSGEPRALCGLTYGIVNRGAEEVVVAATIESASGTILMERRNMPIPAGEVVFLPLARDEIDWTGLTLRVMVTDTSDGDRAGFDIESRHRFLE